MIGESGGTAKSAVVWKAVRCNARAAFFAARRSRQSFRRLDGMTMNTGLHRIEVTGLGGLAKLTGFAKLIGIGGGGRPEQKAARTSRSGFVWLTAALMIGFGAWTYLSEDASNNPEPLQLAAAAAPEPASTGAKPDPELTTAATPVEAPPPAEAAAAAAIPPIDGLKISSQSWRRGGLGSKALVTFTLRNGNDYAVKDIEITCAFNRMDGSHLTDRKRVIHDTVNMKSRKTFARMHVGFVNVNANKAKCSLVTASRF